MRVTLDLLHEFREHESFLLVSQLHVAVPMSMSSHCVNKPSGYS